VRTANLIMMKRRTVLGGAALLAGAAVSKAATEATAATPQAVSTNANYSGPARTSTPADTVVETNAGKVRGYLRNGIYNFRGMPYGDTTEGANRFLPPQKPKPWPGVYNALGYGSVCPQGANPQWKQPEWVFLHNWDNGITGEDCLRVNVWTPSFRGSTRRPVMVWLHGGGWSGGSSQELPSYDGENISRRGDIVLVSVNHRLNLFGFTNLAGVGGERYAASGNVGLLDLIASLEWVRDNIANFGGDPGNVTVFGQSGGGSKVCHLMASPLAKGLFHKGIVQSGPTMRSGPVEASLKTASAFLGQLGLTASTLEKIHTLPYAHLQEAYVASAPSSGGFINSGPVMDGKIVASHPFDPVATPLGANIPLLIGNNSHEMVSIAMSNPKYEDMSEAELKELLAKPLGDRADRVIRAFRNEYPNAKPVDLHGRISCWNGFMGAPTLKLAEIKAAQPAAVYRYVFSWCTKALDGRPRAYHCAELAFAFDNIDRCANATGGGPEARALAAKVSQAWINFARNGNPNHSGLPNWPALKPGQLNTMVFDTTPKMVVDPDRQGRLAIEGKA